MDKIELLKRLVSIQFQQPFFNKLVEIENGKIMGRREKLHRVVCWYDIPYAAPATGKLRWRKPQPAQPIKGVLNCISPSRDRNIQNFGSKTFGTEGKLTLNICRPDSTDKDLPVLVYFHGGNFQVGNPQEWLGNKFCMERNVVHVSIDYRLGVLGFNTLPALRTGDPEEDSGNYMLLDCKAALEWVQRNIKTFGGNPDDITVCGHSAGACACLSMLISPLFKNLFHKAIVFNAPPVTCPPEKAQLVFAHRFSWLAIEEGLFTHENDALKWLLSEKEADRKSVKKWLYSLNAQRIINLFPLSGVRMHLFPCCFTDGVVLPKDGYATDSFNSVPLLLLCSGAEFSAFIPVDKFFKSRFKLNPQDEQLKAEMNFAKWIGNSLYQYQNSGLIAETIGSRYQNNIYISSLDYGNNEGGVDKRFVERYGAVHGNILPIITDQYKIPWKRGNDFFQHQGAIRLSELILSCIYSFMCSGNPNCSELKLDWHPWSNEKHSIIVFNADRETYLVSDTLQNFSYEDLFINIDSDDTISDESKKAILSQVLAHRWFSEELDKHYNNPNPWYAR